MTARTGSGPMVVQRKGRQYLMIDDQPEILSWRHDTHF